MVQEAGILIKKVTGGLPCIGVVREQGINVFIVLCIVIEEVGQKSRTCWSAPEAALRNP